MEYTFSSSAIHLNGVDFLLAMTSKVAVVTGANKGIGLEVARQLARAGVIVILTARDEAKGKSAVDQLVAEGLEVYFHQLDVTNDVSVELFAKHMQEGIGRVDILVNNAGIFLESNDDDFSVSKSILDIPLTVFWKEIDTNTFGALRMIRALRPVFSPEGRIINVSSIMGQISSMDSGYGAYRMSKTALNVITRVLSDELSEGTDISINSVCPGWVKTDMGGSRALKTVEEGADTIVWLALYEGKSPTGKFFSDRSEIAW